MSASAPTAPAAAGQEDLLVVEGLELELPRRGAGPLQLLRGVDLAVGSGEILGVIGESGSGKTMTCRVVVGAAPEQAVVTDGRVTLEGGVLRESGPVRRMRSDPRIGMVFADPHASLDPLQRVGPHIAEVARLRAGLEREAAQARAIELLERVSIPRPQQTARLYPFELSGGMAQRAMIAAALAGRPTVILADEPTSALDATVQVEVLELLRELADSERVGILLTTHDMAVVARACDRIAVMYAGRVVEHGTAERVLGDPQHPYTKLLLEARPRGRRGTPLPAIPGEPPLPGDWQPPCSFAPRCPYAQDACRERQPPLEATRDGGAALCHFVGKLPERGA